MDEPSNGELGRSLGEVKAMVANLVSTREYAEFQRYVTHLLGELTKDIAEERAAREAAFRELRAEQAAGRQISKNARLTAVGTLLGGIALAIFTGWAHLGGGH